MKIILIITFLFFYFSAFSQDMRRLDLLQNRIKTNLSQYVLNDFNLAYEYVYNKNTFGFGIGYRINDLYKKKQIPEYNADRIIDLTCLLNYRGPNAQISYKRFMDDCQLSEKKYFNCDLYYKKNNYDQIAIYHGSNGINQIQRDLIVETADLIGIRLLFGKEISVNDYWFFEIYGGIGYVHKIITRKTISMGYSGNYTDIIVNQEISRQANHPTIQFGIKTGLMFDKKI